jgi:hypothetical protein
MRELRHFKLTLTMRPIQQIWQVFFVTFPTVFIRHSSVFHPFILYALQYEENLTDLQYESIAVNSTFPL